MLSLLSCAIVTTCSGDDLLQVYTTLVFAVAMAAIGVATDIAFHVGGILTTVAAIGSMLWLMSTSAAPENQVRHAALKRHPMQVHHPIAGSTGVSP